MSKRTVAVVFFSWLALGFVTPAVDFASAGQVESPGGASVQAERLRERAERVQQRRKARVSQAKRQAVANRVKAEQLKGSSQKTVHERGRKEVAK